MSFVQALLRLISLLATKPVDTNFQSTNVSVSCKHPVSLCTVIAKSQNIVRTNICYNVQLGTILTSMKSYSVLQLHVDLTTFVQN